MSNSLFDLTNRVAVVIGGTSGLGRSISLALASAGATVVPTGRRADLIESLNQEIAATGRKTLTQATDASQRASVDSLRSAVVKTFGQVDILVNAAGKTLKRPTESITEVEWNDVFDVNLTGMLRCCQSFYEPLKQSGHGRIINIASLSSFVGFYQVAAYSTSKAAVLSLTQNLAIEWAKDNICVNAISPGVFPTELNSQLLNGTERGREILTRTPMKRFGKPEELGGAAIFLASDAASFITGTSLAVDGGYLCSGVNS